MDKICSELERYKSEQPNLGPVIDLNKKILEIQESVRAKLGPAPAVSSFGTDNLAAGVPAMNEQIPQMPFNVFRTAAEDLAELFGKTSGVSFPLEDVFKIISSYGNDVSSFARDLLADKLDLESLSSDTGFNPETMAFFFHSLLVPFFSHSAMNYHPLFQNREIPWTKGKCPFCGTPPRYSVIYGEKGFRKLFCGMCHTQWEYPRHKCSDCENPERTEIRQLSLGDDSAHFAEVCDTCHSYIKTTDERKLKRECRPQAEDIITAPIDMVATREGFTRPA
ncbi:formate dehydrogenase accessory protein [Dehalogenimonas lykanthroporepellens BL-DC-9]|nr:formate dehydrogenase accessory protein [Dehalogenimonas lykanthroporepellens BL-DC-9]